MMLKTVYGLPPADMERIEASEKEEESCICEEAAGNDPVKSKNNFGQKVLGVSSVENI